MKKRRTIVLFLCLVIFMSTGLSANAQKGYFNEYTPIFQVKKARKCTSMQGMCIDSKKERIYYIRKNRKDTKAVIGCLDLSKKKVKKVKLKYKTKKGKKSSKTSIISCLAHANDMEFVRIGKTAYLFVVTRSEKSYQLVKLKVTGRTYKTVAKYKVYATKDKDGEPLAKKKKTSVSGISLISKKGNQLTFMMKSGATIYKATVGKHWGSKKPVMLSAGCTLDLRESKINGKKVSNIDKFCSQGITYHKGKVFAPFTNKNVSVIFVFSVNGKKDLPERVVGDSNLSFRITSKVFSKFEIESCAIAKDGRIYFSCNTDGTDKIAYFKNKSKVFKF